MQIQKVQNTSEQRKPRFNYVKITGYGALGCGVASGVLGVKKKIKPHKILAYAAALLAVIHTALIEIHHINKKKSGN